MISLETVLSVGHLGIGNGIFSECEVIEKLSCWHVSIQIRLLSKLHSDGHGVNEEFKGRPNKISLPIGNYSIRSKIKIAF